MIRALKHSLGVLGFEIRRASRTGLPVIWECECDGVRFPFWIANEHAAAWWMNSAVRFDAEMRFLKSVTRPGSVVLEVGAHHGMHTVQIARWAGVEGEIHAFELSSGNALILSANVGLNRLTQVRVLHTAVGAKEGMVAAQGERVVPGEGGLAVLSLDSYCETLGIESIDVLKIDVEGFEANVIRGAKRVLSSRPSIDLELHLDDLPLYGDSPADVFTELALQNYEVSMMVRPDWNGTSPLKGVNDLPASGVVNLFLRPTTT